MTIVYLGQMVASIVHLYVAFDLTWFFYMQPRAAHLPDLLSYEYFYRLGLSQVMFAMPLLIPNPFPFNSILSSFAVPLLGIFVPALTHLCLRYAAGGGRCDWIVYCDVLCMVFAVGVSIYMGTYNVRILLHELLR